MSHDKLLLRWIVLGRWFATAGVALAIGFGYFAFRPASARSGPPVRLAE